MASASPAISASNDTPKSLTANDSSTSGSLFFNFYGFCSSPVRLLGGLCSWPSFEMLSRNFGEAMLCNFLVWSDAASFFLEELSAFLFSRFWIKKLACAFSSCSSLNSRNKEALFCHILFGTPPRFGFCSEIVSPRFCATNYLNKAMFSGVNSLESSWRILSESRVVNETEFVTESVGWFDSVKDMKSIDFNSTIYATSAFSDLSPRVG